MTTRLLGCVRRLSVTAVLAPGSERELRCANAEINAVLQTAYTATAIILTTSCNQAIALLANVSPSQQDRQFKARGFRAFKQRGGARW